MKRRGFLGFMGGAAVAGPAVAKQAVAQLPPGLGISGMPMPSYGYPADANSVGPDPTWKLKQIADIRRFLSGDLTDEEKEDRKRQRLYRREQVINQNVACLHSVSGSRKLAIYSSRIEQHYDEIQRSERQSRLHWLLRQED